jgi:hypothetical protein
MAKEKRPPPRMKGIPGLTKSFISKIKSPVSSPLLRPSNNA